MDELLKKCEENDQMRDYFEEFTGVEDVFLFELIFLGTYEELELNNWKRNYPDLWNTSHPASIRDILRFSKS